MLRGRRAHAGTGRRGRRRPRWGHPGGGPAFGAGILGYGFLLDVAGDDVYKADRLACGMAAFGVGVLLDRSGKDKYEIDLLGQEAAFKITVKDDNLPKVDPVPSNRIGPIPV